jgi:hypothetical protein
MQMIVINNSERGWKDRVILRLSSGFSILRSLPLLVLLAVLTRACGQESPSSESGGSASDGGSANGSSASGGGSASHGKFQGVVTSYEVAQSEIEEDGGEKAVGEYRVGYIVEPAEGWWEGPPGNLTWREPAAGETNHIEILPFEAETGLLVPNMQGTLTVLDNSGEEVESKPLELYRGQFYHYANNFSLPGSGTYTLRAALNPPEFRRHETEEESAGKVFTEPVTVEFENVEIRTRGK